MHAVLIDLLNTSDPTIPLASFQLEDPRSFYADITAIASPSEGIGEEWFSLSVTTARWIAEHPLTKGHLWGAYHLLLERWDYDRLWRLIADRCLHAEGETWTEILAKLTPFLRAEESY